MPSRHRQERTVRRSRERGPRAASPERAAAATLAELRDLRAVFGPRAARRKLALLSPRSSPVFRSPEKLIEYHDLLLFLRAYADSPRLLRETERRLRAFPDRVAAYGRAARDPSLAGLLDSGIVGTAASHLFSFRLARSLAARHPREVEIDWETYQESPTANLSYALGPAMLWHEAEAVDNDDAFDERAWLEGNRTRRDPTCLAALFRLLATSGLSEAVQEHLYDAAEVPVRWDLTQSRGSRTWKRLPWRRPFLQAEPLRGRTRDLRRELRRPAPPLRLLSRARGSESVGAIHAVLASRVRELYPLAGANPDEVYLYEPGRGVQITVFGCLPAVRLPHETNMGAMLARNGVPVGYGVAALFFERAEIAINVFPAYRAGESSFLIEQFFHLFVRHFGSRLLLVRSYQVGDDNEEGLESGAFWFYDKLGFRPVRPAVRALAHRERARVEADPSYRTPMAVLKRLAKSDLFFHVDASRMRAYEDLSLAHLGYALTRQIARRDGGDRSAAVEGSIRRLSRSVPVGDIHRWTEGERLGLRRLAPMIDALPGVASWPREDRERLGRLLRAKGAARERRYVRLSQRIPRLEAAWRRLARTEEKRRTRESAS